MTERIDPRVKGGRIALGPTFVARLVPWLKWGAPLLAALFLPVTGLYVGRISGWPWFVSLPLAWCAGWVLLALLMLAVLACVHRTTWWDPVAGEIRRGRQHLAVAHVQAVVPDFRPQGVTALEAGRGPDACSSPIAAGTTAVTRESPNSSEGYSREGASRPQLLARDRAARKSWENRALAKKYGMAWRGEFEDPHVFLEAFDARRKQLARRRR